MTNDASAQLEQPRQSKVGETLQEKRDALVSTRSVQLVSAAVLLVALLIRLVYVPLGPRVDPLLRGEGELRHDARAYDDIGWNLAVGRGYTRSISYADMDIYPPLYPYMLAGVYNVCGHRLVAVRLVQAVLGALTCLLLSLIGTRLAGQVVGLVAGLGLAFHPLYLGFTGWLYTETLYIFLFVLALFLWVELARRPNWMRTVVLGFVWGLAALARPVFVVAPLLFFVWGLIRVGSKLKVAGLTILLVACIYAIQAPWLIYRSTDREQTSLTSSGVSSPLVVTIWQFNNRYADGGEQTELSMLVSDLQAWEALSPNEQNQEAFRLMLDWIVTRPHEYLLNSGKRLLKFFSPFEFGAMTNRRGAKFPLPMVVQIPVLAAYSMYLVVALVGLISSLRRWRAFLPLYLTFGYFFVFHVFIWSAFTRYSMPAMTIVIVWAACGVVWLFERFSLGGLRARLRSPFRSARTET